ncbi:MAG TPA: hypothetical protein VEG33_07915 [Streptosporangiaceae bacterium]|nr:hypothetical protein [Streptosporangiaceae bacterium]
MAAAGHPGLALIPVTADIATGAGVTTVVASASGRVDALANVAGIMDGFLPPAEIDDQTWERVFAVKRFHIGGLPVQELCGAHADGLWFDIQVFGAHPSIDVTSLFRDHMRLLGTNPANWTTKPIG